MLELSLWMWLYMGMHYGNPIFSLKPIQLSSRNSSNKSGITHSKKDFTLYNLTYFDVNRTVVLNSTYARIHMNILRTYSQLPLQEHTIYTDKVFTKNFLLGLVIS